MNIISSFTKYFTSKLKAILAGIQKTFFMSSNAYDMAIGQVLKLNGVITEEQLQEALNAQREGLNRYGRAIRLGQVMVELGYATEDKVVQAINEYYRLSVTSLSDNIKEFILKKRKSVISRRFTTRVPMWLQLSIAVTLIIIFTIIAMSFFYLRRQQEQLYQQTVKIGMVSLNYFSNSSRIALLENDILSLNTLIREASTVDGILYAIITDKNQIIKAHTDLNKLDDTFIEFENVEKVVKERDITYFDYTGKSGKRILNLVRPVVFKGKRLGEVHVGVSIDFIEQEVRKKRTTVIVIAQFIILLGVIIAVLLGFWFSRPISKLVIATQEIGKGNYQYKIDMTRHDELGRLAAAFNLMSKELYIKSVMQESFGKYVGPEIFDMIMANSEDAGLKGHRNEATIIFTDIRGFSSYSETKEPEEIVEKLNEYFTIVTRATLAYGGYVDKFIGDAVLSVFGVPVYYKNHVERALRAAIEMQSKFIEESNRKNELLKSIGIGINTGVVVSGNIGSQVKMEYTVIGNTVNLASRLNGLAGAGEIIVSKEICEQLCDMIKVKALPPQKIKGMSDPIMAFKVLGIDGENNVTA